MPTLSRRAAPGRGARPTADPGAPLSAPAAYGRAAADRDLLRDIAALVQNHLQQPHGHEPAGHESDPYATLSTASGEARPVSSRFRVLRPHARGGLGEVYLARDEELHREVALKEIQPDHADDPLSRARFVLEAEITGRLEHPGVVPVYSFGAYADGRPFYAMRLIKGVSFTEAIERFHAEATGGRFRSREFRGLLGRLIDVCNALEYAHSRGVLHRDLKPDNVMLGKYGETLVVDWGLAKILNRPDAHARGDEPTLQPSSGGDSGATQMGVVLGTPQYMSPEQAEGRVGELGPASDVYSLGAMLYTLLTGSAPLGKGDVGIVLRRVAAGEFPPPRYVCREAPRALEAICLKAMARGPADRYQSPRALADDLEHWLADEPVTALREPLSERLARWGRRHRAWTRAMGAALMLVAMFAMAAALLVERERRAERAERQLAALNRDAAEELTHELLKLTRQSSAAGHPAMVAAALKLARSAEERGEGSEAVTLYQEILDDCRQRGDPPNQEARQRLQELRRARDWKTGGV